MPEQQRQPLSKKTTRINESFKCLNCKKNNPKATKTCRNHCRYCLFSLHVDSKLPGDRQSNCLGLMEPISISYQAKKGQQIIHICRLCGKQMTNKLAEDDDQPSVIIIMQRQNLEPLNPNPKW